LILNAYQSGLLSIHVSTLWPNSNLIISSLNCYYFCETRLKRTPCFNRQNTYFGWFKGVLGEIFTGNNNQNPIYNKQNLFMYSTHFFTLTFLCCIFFTSLKDLYLKILTNRVESIRTFFFSFQNWIHRTNLLKTGLRFKSNITFCKIWICKSTN
jgi:hypothetical protein